MKPSRKPKVGKSGHAGPAAAKSEEPHAALVAKPPVYSRVWHLSDLHFDSEPPRDAKVNTESLDSWDEDENEGLRSFAELQGADLLIISGDLVNAGAIADRVRAANIRTKKKQLELTRELRKKAFGRANAYIKQIATMLGLGDRLASRVVVCPGNHDVEWGVDPNERSSAMRQFKFATREFVTPYSTEPWVIDRTLGWCILVVDTARRGGSTFKSGDAKFLADAPSYDVKEIRETLVRLRAKLGVKANAELPGQFLCACVGHHPLSMAPYRGTEVKPFSHAIGAEAAKLLLLEAGFRLFLHGHRHTAAAIHERVLQYSGSQPEAWVLAAPSVRKAEGGYIGFHSIVAAVSPVSGEANLRVTQMVAAHAKPAPGGAQWLVRVNPRALPEAEQIKFLERIGPEGNSRTDVAFFGVTVPRVGEPLRGWKRKGDKLELTIPRVFQSSLAQTGSPKVETLTPKCTAAGSMTSTEGVHQMNAWVINVSAPQTVRSVGVIERSFTPCGYAVSKRHQLWVAGMSTIVPEVDRKVGQEWVMHTMRVPARELEFFIRWPSEMPKAPKVELRAFIEVPASSTDSSPTLGVPANDLLALSDCRIDAMWQMKRCRVIISKPLTGVVYAVAWDLPDHTERKQRSPSDKEMQRSAMEAETLRATMIEHADDASHPIFQPLATLVQEIERDLRAAHLIIAGELEAVVFVPQEPLAKSEKGHILPPTGGRPRLVPVYLKSASLPSNKPPTANVLSGITWDAGRGLAGRCFSTNVALSHTSPTAKFVHNFRSESWSEPDVGPYEPVDGMMPHEVLYSLPLNHPDAEDFVFGVVCLGSYLTKSGFDWTLPPVVKSDDYQTASGPARSIREGIERRLIQAIRDSLLIVEGDDVS